MRTVARIYEQVSNVRQDYLHKLSRKIVQSSSGTGEANANGEEVRPIRGRKPKMRLMFAKLEAQPTLRERQSRTAEGKAG